MIRALVRQLLNLDARRAVGLLLVLVLVVVAVAGAVHGGDPTHNGHACSVCDATLAIAGAAVPTPPIRLSPHECPERFAHRAPKALASFDVDVVHAPRGPPVCA